MLPQNQRLVKRVECGNCHELGSALWGELPFAKDLAGLEQIQGIASGQPSSFNVRGQDEVLLSQCGYGTGHLQFLPGWQVVVHLFEDRDDGRRKDLAAYRSGL
jgi:hypothetical protein